MLQARPRGLRLPPPERRRRSDLVVAGSIAVVVALVAALMWATAPHTNTVSTPAAAPVAAPPDATAVPVGFTEAWRARERRVAGPGRVRSRGRDRRRGHGGRPGRRDGRGPLELPARPTAVRRRHRLPRPRRRPGVGALPQRRLVQRDDLAAPGHRHPGPPAQPRRAPRHPPDRGRLAGHRDGVDLPRGVPVGPGQDRRVRRRAHPAAGRAAAAAELRVHRFRRDGRPRGGAAALSRRADRAPDRPGPRRRRGRQAAGGVLRPAPLERRDAGRGVGGPGGRRAARPAAAGAARPVRRAGRAGRTRRARPGPGPAARRRRRERERRRRRGALVDGLADGGAGRARPHARSGRCPTPSARGRTTPVACWCRCPPGSHWSTAPPARSTAPWP